MPDMGYAIRDLGYVISEFETRNEEHRRCSITVVQRMLDNPIIAPDADQIMDDLTPISRRDEG